VQIFLVNFGEAKNSNNRRKPVNKLKRHFLYLREFSFRNFLTVFSIVVTIYFLRKFIYLGINKYIICPFGIDQIKKDINLDLFSIFLFLGCLTWLIYLLVWRRLFPSINSCINIILVTICYLLVIRYSGVYNFQSIQTFQSIKYLDILFFCFLLILSKFKYYNAGDKGESIYGFIEDNFNPEFNNDILSRQNYAHKIGLKILGTNSLNKAFVIAINSPWGFGKSGFLSLLEQFFKVGNRTDFITNAVRSSDLIDANEINRLFLRRNNTIIVRYNPWKNFDDKKIVQDFFDELSSSISKYDSHLSKKVKKYGRDLTKLDDTVFSKLVSIAVDSIASEGTLTELFDEINNSIDRIQKKIIVFIDDLDRLTGDELIDILKLIRNTANFRNTFFIVAYDHNYVLNTIEKKNLISSKEEYLQKIVQLEITLPIFQKNILIQFLEEQITEYKPLAYGFDKIQLAINEILAINVLVTPKPGTSQNNSTDLSDFFFRSERTDDSLLFRVFQNIRDVVRFVNSLKVSFESIGEFADIYEIVLLEILKVKHLSIYQLISNKRFLHVVDEKYEFDFDNYDGFITDEVAKTINIKLSEKEVIRVILDSIFNSKRKIYFRSIKYPPYFDIYFTYQAPKLIQLEKIESALEAQEIDQIIDVIDESVKQETFDDLRNFLDSQDEFTSKNEFEITLKSLFYISKYDPVNKSNTLFQIKNILRNKSIVEDFYPDSKAEYSALLLSILRDTKYDLKTRSEIAGDELYKIINKEAQNDDDSILRNHKNDLQGILLNCLKDKMKEVSEFNMELFNYYIKNLKEIESGTRQIVITKEANEAMKDFILSHKFEYFKKYLLREHPEPSFAGQYFQLDPFLLYYFGNKWDVIGSELVSQIVKENFEKEENGKEFHEFLTQIVDEYASKKDEKILITDKRKIDLAEKFIAITQR
jgi:hypothetical protein